MRSTFSLAGQIQNELPEGYRESTSQDLTAECVTAGRRPTNVLRILQRSTNTEKTLETSDLEILHLPRAQNSLYISKTIWSQEDLD